MKLGIIGAENSHTIAIAKTINVDKKIRGFSVEYVWGEKPEYAEKASVEGKIPVIVRRPIDMLGKVDAVVVDHRDGKYHLKAVWPFVEAGVPTFVDKPFCYRAAEGKAFLKMAKKVGTPVTSFSVLTHQASFAQFKAKMAELGGIVSGTTYGPCDLKSQWGGIFFYGIHQVDLVLHAFGFDVTGAQVTKNGLNAVGQLLYASGLTVTMALIKEGTHAFGIGAVGTKGALSAPIKYDKNPYLTGVETFTRMFRTGKEPLTYEQILRPVQVLEALERSVKSGKVEKVAR